MSVKRIVDFVVDDSGQDLVEYTLLTRAWSPSRACSPPSCSCWSSWAVVYTQRGRPECRRSGSRVRRGGLSVTTMPGIQLAALSIAVGGVRVRSADAAHSELADVRGGRGRLRVSRGRPAAWAGQKRVPADGRLGIALLLTPYWLGGMGAGDVKLVGALGAWLGPGDTFWLAMYTGIAGAVAALDRQRVAWISEHGA